VKKIFLRVYRVDLPVLFAVRLRGASAVDLTGIDPVKAWQEELPGDATPRKAEIALPAREKGAYLVVGRAGDGEDETARRARGGSVQVKEFSSVLLRSDLEIDVQRVGGRIRVNVYKKNRDGARTPRGGAYVRISDGSSIRGSGKTDARGVFEAQVPPGKAIILAEHDGHFALMQE